MMPNGLCFECHLAGKKPKRKQKPPPELRWDIRGTDQQDIRDLAEHLTSGKQLRLLWPEERTSGVRQKQDRIIIGRIFSWLWNYGSLTMEPISRAAEELGISDRRAIIIAADLGENHPALTHLSDMADRPEARRELTDLTGCEPAGNKEQIPLATGRQTTARRLEAGFAYAMTVNYSKKPLKDAALVLCIKPPTLSELLGGFAEDTGVELRPRKEDHRPKEIAREPWKLDAMETERLDGIYKARPGRMMKWSGEAKSILWKEMFEFQQKLERKATRFLSRPAPGLIRSVTGETRARPKGNSPSMWPPWAKARLRALWLYRPTPARNFPPWGALSLTRKAQAALRKKTSRKSRK